MSHEIDDRLGRLEVDGYQTLGSHQVSNVSQLASDVLVVVRMLHGLVEGEVGVGPVFLGQMADLQSDHVRQAVKRSPGDIGQEDHGVSEDGVVFGQIRKVAVIGMLGPVAVHAETHLRVILEEFLETAYPMSFTDQCVKLETHLGSVSDGGSACLRFSTSLSVL